MKKAHKTPQWVYDTIATEHPFCERRELFHDHECQGRLTMEHVWIYSGCQINEVWAIIHICDWAHSTNGFQDRGGLDKEINEFISLRRATPQDLAKYPRRDWIIRKRYLDLKYEKRIA